MAMQNSETPVHIDIDGLTPCLVRMSDGLIVKTSFSKAIINDDSFDDWVFDWKRPERDGFEVFGLKADGDSRFQGLISMAPDRELQAVRINIVESAPFNSPHNPAFVQKEYEGVGAHLFAEACRYSDDLGYNGYVLFTAKTNLVNYYRETLGAQLIGKTGKMYIDEFAAKILLERYYGGV